MVAFILANSADPDEMQHYAALHLGLHCLAKNPFICIQNEKDLIDKRLSKSRNKNF